MSSRQSQGLETRLPLLPYTTLLVVTKSQRGLCGLPFSVRLLRVSWKSCVRSTLCTPLHLRVISHLLFVLEQETVQIIESTITYKNLGRWETVEERCSSPVLYVITGEFSVRCISTTETTGPDGGHCYTPTKPMYDIIVVLIVSLLLRLFVFHGCFKMDLQNKQSYLDYAGMTVLLIVSHQDFSSFLSVS